jgi:hypothetical protein
MAHLASSTRIIKGSLAPTMGTENEHRDHLVSFRTLMIVFVLLNLSLHILSVDDIMRQHQCATPDFS